MLPLSVVIITYNEEKNIGRCLASVKDIADEIIVVDSFSTDNTEEICRHYGVQYIQHQWEGYSATKNYANSIAKYDWIFSIDADEAISDELKKSILDAKINTTNATTFKINRKANYCGKWIKYGGWNPDYKVRLFDKRKMKWEGAIHEYINAEKEKKIPCLAGVCYHYTYYSIEEHLLKTESYTDIAAKELYEKNRKGNSIKLLFGPVVKFIRDYFFRFGLFDGYYGFIICIISARATYLKYKKLKKLNKDSLLFD